MPAGLRQAQLTVPMSGFFALQMSATTGKHGLSKVLFRENARPTQVRRPGPLPSFSGTHHASPRAIHQVHGY
jgi:hypothetical protein